MNSIIKLDSNEDSQKRKLHEDLKPKLLSSADVEVGRLEVGDLTFLGKTPPTDEMPVEQFVSIGMELKYFPEDLIQSLQDKRILHQLPRMIREYSIPYLFFIGPQFDISIGGKVTYLRHRKGEMPHREESYFSYNYVNSILTKFESAGGRVRHCKDVNHLAQTVLSIHSWWNKTEHDTEMFLPRKVDLNKPFVSWELIDDKLPEFYYQMGIGRDRALALAEYFPNVEDLILVPANFIATLKLQNGRNFGTISAQKVFDFLHKPHGKKTDKAVKVELR